MQPPTSSAVHVRSQYEIIGLWSIECRVWSTQYVGVGEAWQVAIGESTNGFFHCHLDQKWSDVTGVYNAFSPRDSESKRRERYMGTATASAMSGNLHSVFVYGSLLSDDVVRVLLKRVPQSSSAILNNYHSFSIKGRVYPAIVPLENHKVTGRVLLGITDPELEILDTFEDVEYERTPVDVRLTDTRDNYLQAQAYVWTNRNDPNLYGDWNFEEWRELHREDFVKMTAGFVEELELPESKPRVATYENYYNQNVSNPKLS